MTFLRGCLPLSHGQAVLELPVGTAPRLRWDRATPSCLTDTMYYIVGQPA
jgi:hypothetical protein